MGSLPDFFRYLVSTPEADAWGVVVTGAGRFSALPRQGYPPRGHPPDHAFSWENGRVLGAFQIVYLTEGSGEFDSAATGRVPVNAGTALLLFPGEWHRYRPNADSGWVENWVELGGPMTGRILATKGLSPERPVVVIDRRLELETQIDSIHRKVASLPTASAPELAAHALMALAILHEPHAVHAADRPVATAVREAMRIMEEAADGAASMPLLARQLGVSYSHFRREFRELNGISPRQYHLRIRMQRAQRLIGSSGESLKLIADRLGFSSAYHLSSAFKAAFGIAPNHWRRRKLARS